MSVLDELQGLEQRVAARLRELRPLVAEYEELQRVAERLGLRDETLETAAAETPAPEPAKARRRQTSARAAPRRSRSTGNRQAAATDETATAGPPAKRPRARRAGTARRSASGSASRSGGGQRREAVLALVGERPGITVAEIARELGVDATALYRVVNALRSEGALTKEGRQLRPASASAVNGSGPDGAGPDGEQTAASTGETEGR